MRKNISEEFKKARRGFEKITRNKFKFDSSWTLELMSKYNNILMFKFDNCSVLLPNQLEASNVGAKGDEDISFLLQHSAVFDNDNGYDDL